MISNMSFSPNFKHVILSHLNELLDLQYIVGKFQKYSFYPNFNRSKIPPVTLNMSQIVHEDIV